MRGIKNDIVKVRYEIKVTTKIFTKKKKKKKKNSCSEGAYSKIQVDSKATFPIYI
jgi:hypothetical protein